MSPRVRRIAWLLALWSYRGVLVLVVAPLVLSILAVDFVGFVSRGVIGTVNAALRGALYAAADFEEWLLERSARR